MPIKFKSKNYADILMFDDIALRFIKLMGHSGTVPGAIDAEGIAAALALLESALAQDLQADAQTPDPRDADENDTPPVSLAHRALPLLEMLEKAAQTGSYVMWEK